MLFYIDKIERWRNSFRLWRENFCSLFYFMNLKNYLIFFRLHLTCQNSVWSTRADNKTSAYSTKLKSLSFLEQKGLITKFTCSYFGIEMIVPEKKVYKLVIIIVRYCIVSIIYALLQLLYTQEKKYMCVVLSESPRISPRKRLN